MAKEKLPEIKETDDEIVCPLCHGSGKTTGRHVLKYADLIGSVMLDGYTRVKQHIVPALWKAIKDD